MSHARVKGGRLGLEHAIFLLPSRILQSSFCITVSLPSIHYNANSPWWDTKVLGNFHSKSYGHFSVFIFGNEIVELYNGEPFLISKGFGSLLFLLLHKCIFADMREVRKGRKQFNQAFHVCFAWIKSKNCEHWLIVGLSLPCCHFFMCFPSLSPSCVSHCWLSVQLLPVELEVLKDQWWETSEFWPWD